MQTVIGVHNQEDVAQPGHVNVRYLSADFLIFGIGFIQIAWRHEQGRVDNRFKSVSV